MTENLLPSQPVRRALSATFRKKAFTERLWRLVEEYLAQLEGVMRENITSVSSSHSLIRDIGGLVSTLERLIDLDQKPQPTAGDNTMSTPKSASKGRPSRSKNTASMKACPIDTDSSQARLTQMRDTLLKKLEKWAKDANSHDSLHSKAAKELPPA
jgi:hypothetical protein